MKATKATVAKAAAMSSNITAIANNNSDFPDQASKENNKFVEAINKPEINKALSDEPSKVNEDPMGDAWFFKMKPSDPSQIEDYMTEDEYNKLIS